MDKLVQPAVTDAAIDEFDKTRAIRHEIVHRGRRITHLERGRARQAVDTGRWLFNQLENKPERAQLREHGGALKSTVEPRWHLDSRRR